MISPDLLAENHLRSLTLESAISPEIIEARGYRTVASKAEMRRLGFATSQLLVPALVLPIWNVAGEIAGYQARPDSPRINKGKAVKYETAAGMQMVLDVHPLQRRHLDDPSVPLWVTEGLKKGDALTSQDCCAISLLGVWNWRGTNEKGGKTVLAAWESIALKGRRIFLVFDSDVMVKSQVHAALSRLRAFLESRGAEVLVVYLPGGAGGAKVGVDDFLAAGRSIDDLLALASAELREQQRDDELDEDDGQDEAEGGSTQADAMVAIGRRGDLFHDTSGAPMARLQLLDHHEVWPLKSKSFSTWLRRQHYLENQKAPGSNAVASALGVLEGIARFDGPSRELHNRVARIDDAIYYDLADAAWGCVRVTGRSWELVPDQPPFFRRHAHQQAQVEPVAGGDPWLLFDFLNVRAEDRLLLLVWIVAALVPDIPHPIVDFYGEKGAGKSVGQRVIRRLLDPSSIESLSFPTDRNELVQQLSHHYAPVYDNVDGLSPGVSDILCRAVTGEGFSKRELYSDDDDVIYSYRRVLMLNGINVVAQRADLLDRTILIGLERIDRERRKDEQRFWTSFEAARPLIFGGMLDALVGALRVVDSLQFDQLERMADFTRYGAAIATALGRDPGEFIDSYRANLGQQNREAVEAHVVGRAIVALMQERDNWSGSPSQLLAALEDIGTSTGLFKRSVSGRIDIKGWPGAPHILTRRLNEIRSNLREIGLSINEGHDEQRRIEISRVEGSESSVGSVGAVGQEWDTFDATDATDATDAETAAQTSGWEKRL